ncbi:MAG TPA: carboxypeptidase regulatory-like domain-containing protein [Longimicrobium sp.]|nr:carboxypeptidase regulatory-like domain-containing protein [Longimicrobium sp.]
MNASKLVLALAAALCAAPALSAQTVRGRFVDPAGQPVPGGRAVLRDGRGREVAAGMTGADGGFVLRAPAAGRYSLAVERIGYALTTEPAFPLPAAQTVEKRVVANAQRVALQGLAVRGAQCAPWTGAGPEAASVWEEARKALRSARENESAEYQYGVRRFWRQLDPAGRTIVADSVAPVEVTRGNPFVSAPADRLAQTGFIESAGSDLVFHAPDAAVLLSTEFQDAHCFGLREGEDGLIGLAFAPVAQGDRSDVVGTLWIDRATAELRRVEYRYTRVPGMSEPSDAASGRMDFRRMRDGRWIVSRWSVRMPVIVAEAAPGAVQVQIENRPTDQGQLRYRLAAQLEQGGDVLNVATPAGRVELAGAGTVRGVVFDSTQLQPLVGARVTLGSAHTAVTDSAGRFAIGDVPAGEYRLAFSSARLDSLGFVPAAVRLSVREGATAERDLTVPPLAAVWASACADSGQAPGRGVLVGRVHAANGDPQPYAHVAVSWTQPGAPAESAAALTADSHGVYRFCTAPAGPPLTVRVAAGRSMLTVSDLHVAQGRALRQDVGLPAAGAAVASAAAPAGAAQTTLSGVVRGAGGQTLAGATVRFGEQAPVSTDGQGRFRMRAPPPREYAVRVTHPELGTRTTRVTLTAGGGEVDLRPGPDGSLAATVQKVVQLAAVQAQARNLTLDIQGFYERQRHGQGIFLNEERLQRNKAGRLTDVLRGVPGIRVVRYVPRDSLNARQRFEMRSGMDVDEQYRIASSRGNTAIINGQGPCWMDVYVDGVQVQNWNPNTSQSLDSFPLAHVQAVEVYRGASEIPEAYKQAWSACGVVLLWTKS